MKIKNVNRKLIAGILTVTLLAGCSSESHGLPTETTAKGEVVYSFCEFDDIKDWKVVVFDSRDEEEFYIMKKSVIYSRHFGLISYSDIFGKYAYDIVEPGGNDSKIISEGDLLSYLVIYDKIQSSYTEEDLKEILGQIKADFEMQEEKIKSLEN